MSTELVVGGKLVRGVWLPESEVHLVDMLHQGPVRDGKGTYQIRKLDAAMALLPQDRRRVAVDVGAHVGLWSMWLTKLFAKVEAFEPVPLHRQLYERNVTGSYRLHPVALGDGESTVNIEVPEETTGNAHIAIGRRHSGTRHVPNPDRQHVIEGVPMLPLDSFQFDGVDFLKVDVEGYELGVMMGAKATLLRCRPVIVVEQKGHDPMYGYAKDAAVAYLESLGFVRAACLAGDWIMRWGS
jgi:FkbM family methyltransferase